MKYRFGLPVALVAAGTPFVACGDESTSELVKAESYASGEDLPECKASNKGYFAVVPSKSEVYVCSETEKDGAKAWNWTAVGGSAPVVATPELDCKAEELKIVEVKAESRHILGKIFLALGLKNLGASRIIARIRKETK